MSSINSDMDDDNNSHFKYSSLYDEENSDQHTLLAYWKRNKIVLTASITFIVYMLLGAVVFATEKNCRCECLLL